MRLPITKGSRYLMLYTLVSISAFFIIAVCCVFTMPPHNSQFDNSIALQSPDSIVNATVLFHGQEKSTVVITVVNHVFDSKHQQLPPVIVGQRVEIGYTFPTQDKVFRVTGVGKSGPRTLLYIDKTTVDVAGYTMTPGSVCIPFDSRCRVDTEKICFDVEAPDDNDVVHAAGCWVLIYPFNAMRGGFRDGSTSESCRVFAWPGTQIPLDSNYALELIQVVPSDAKRKMGGWAEFRIRHGDEVIQPDPKIPTT